MGEWLERFFAAELNNDCYHIDDYDLYVDPPVETEEEESLSEEESDVDTDDVSCRFHRW